MKFRHLIFAAAVSGMALASCQEKLTPEIPAGEQEVYTVKLACAGELDVTHAPLTKGENTDLYGIQVYYAPVSGGSYQHYAYGLFDDVSDISLDLIADYKYKFVIDMIVDGKNVIYSSNMNTPEDEVLLLGYGAPFTFYKQKESSYESTLCPITNELILTHNDAYNYFAFLGRSIRLLDGEVYEFPKGVDVYYGKQEGYVPTEDGATIVINMKRMIYGLKVIADVNQGTVKGDYAYILDASSCYRDSFDLTAPSNLVYEATYAYTDRDKWYQYDVQNDAKCNSQIRFRWVKDENTTLRLDTQNIRMIRMKQTIVNVTFYEDESAGSNRVTMVFDDLEMTENDTQYTFGDDQSEYEW